MASFTLHWPHPLYLFMSIFILLAVAENTAEAGQDGSLQGTISPDIGIGSGAITQQKCPNPPTVAGARIALAVEIVFGGVQMKVSYTW